MWRRIQYPLFAFLAAFATFIRPPRADLAPISPEQLRDAVVSHDALYPNQRASYTVEETFDHRINPEITALFGTYQFCRDGGRYFYDVSLKETGRSLSKSKFAFDGHLRTQFFAGQNTGDLFKDNMDIAWPSPSEFGLGSRNVADLGARIAAGKITSVQTSNWDGHSCYLVAWFGPNGVEEEAWIDPSADWRARRLQMSGGKPGWFSQETSADFQKLPSGVWYPASGVEIEYYQGPRTNNTRIISHTERLVVTHAEVGFAATDRDFTIAFPNGTAVYDHIVNLGYVVGPRSLLSDARGPLDQVAGLGPKGIAELAPIPNRNLSNALSKVIALVAVCALLAFGGYLVARVTRRTRTI